VHLEPVDGTNRSGGVYVLVNISIIPQNEAKLVSMFLASEFEEVLCGFAADSDGNCQRPRGKPCYNCSENGFEYSFRIERSITNATSVCYLSEIWIAEVTVNSSKKGKKSCKEPIRIKSNCIAGELLLCKTLIRKHFFI
jgi:hypothetical protein